MQAPEHIRGLFPVQIARSGGDVHTFEVPPAVKRQLQKKDFENCRDWTHDNRYLRDDTKEAVPWSKTATPYLDDLLYAISLPWVQDLVFIGCPQSGKSELGHNVVGWSVEHWAGPVLYVYPDELTAKENSGDRVLPMFKDSKSLRGYMTGVDDDETSTLIRLRNVSVFFAWSSSVRRLANKPIKILIEDELDKFDQSAGAKEGDPSKLAKKRTTRFGDRYKRVRISTTTVEDGPIESAYKESRFHFEHHVKCPTCEMLQGMEFQPGETFLYPADQTYQEIREARSARYMCKYCQDEWDDHKRDAAVRAGHWVCIENGESLITVVETIKPKMVAVRLPSWHSSFVSLSEVVADYLQAEESGKPKDKQVFTNQHEAKPYEDVAEDRSLNFLRRNRREDMPRGVVPDESILLLTVDSQQSFFWYEFRAFDPDRGLASHCVSEGRVATFSDLDRLWSESFFVAVSGKEVKPRLALIDSGGTKKEGDEHSRTRQIYEFCRTRPHFLPYKGRDNQVAPWRVSNIDYFPGTNEQIPGGLQLFVCNTSYYKDDLAARIQNDPEGGSSWTFNSDYPDEFLDHYTAEYREDGKWKHNKKKRNDLWDCGHMSLALADILRVGDLAKSRQPKPKARPGVKNKPKRPARSGGAMF